MHYFELFQNIAFTNVLFDGRSLKCPREEYLEKKNEFHSVITSFSSVDLKEEGKHTLRIIKFLIVVFNFFILASNLTRSPGSSMKISAFVSFALLCIDVGEVIS